MNLGMLAFLSVPAAPRSRKCLISPAWGTQGLALERGGDPAAAGAYSERMTWPFVLFLLAWLIGMAGTFVPIIPATLIIFLGAVAATLLGGFQLWPDLPFLITFGVITLLISLIDNVASAWGARKYGGSKQAAWGALIGGLVGIFIPFGLLIGPLLGALLAELIVVRKPPLEALRAAWGTLLGVLGGVAAKFVLHLLMGLYELWRLWEPGRSLF